jgi:hypothetical protein
MVQTVEPAEQLHNEPAQLPRAMGYESVNQSINKTFFDGRFRSAPVYLNLEPEIAEELARRFNVPPAQFEEVLARIVAFRLTLDKANPFSWYLGELDAWVSLERFEPPPFSALLCILSLAAEHMRQDEVFSAQNYYERLFELLNITDLTKKNKFKQNAKSTLQFWKALNKWLAETDFEFGKPTAQQINGWEYASYALSQALVRTTDRKRLHGMFIQFGLSPHEKLSDPEITLYLHEWMQGTSPGHWLKKLWSNTDLRPRVVAAARAELENWDGSDASADSSGSSHRVLKFAASLVTFPRRQLYLFLTASNEEDDKPKLLKLQPDSPQAAVQAFSACGTELYLSPDSTGELLVLEPRRKIELNALMLASFELRDPSLNLRLTRDAKPIVPLLKSETSAYYREISRTALLRTHLVLCHMQWEPRVAAHLALHARPGFKKLTAQELPGLATDWALFSGVEIIRISESEAPELQPLIPLSEGAVLEMTGGLRLAQSLWHSHAPPEITAAAEHGPIAIELREAAISANVKIIAQAESSSSVCDLFLGNAPLQDDSNLTAVVIQDGKDKKETALSLRSADKPKPPITLDAGGIVYRLNPYQPASLFSASSQETDPKNELVLRGMNIEKMNTNDSSASLECNLEALKYQGATESEESNASTEYGMQKVGAGLNLCTLNGHHYWLCEPFQPGDHVRDAKWMTCKYCKNAVLTRNRGKVKKRGSLRGSFKIKTFARAALLPIQMAVRLESKIAPQTLFDALCYLGTGKWKRLQELLSEQAETPWFAYQFARALTDLGHIDAAYDKSLRRPEYWSCAPPALVVTTERRAFLAGFRCTTLVNSVRAALGDWRATAVEQNSAPPALLWDNVDFDAAAERLAQICDPHGHAIAVVHSPAEAIAANAPALGAVEKALPEIHIEETRDLEFFSPAAGLWNIAHDLNKPGAYRTSFAGNRYFYKSSSGMMREGPAEVVKILSARDAALRLHGYDKQTSTFQCVIGCEPPGLFRRALIACSGVLPTRSGATLAYTNVPQTLAASIISKLYN